MRLTQRVIQFGLAAMLLSLSFSAEAQQQPNRVHRIGYLSPAASLNGSPAIESFRQVLKALGYVEGENIVIDWRFAKCDAAKFPGSVAELVGLKVDCIVTTGTLAIRSAKFTSEDPQIRGDRLNDAVAQFAPAAGYNRWHPLGS